MPKRALCYAANVDCTTMLRHSVYASITTTVTASASAAEAAAMTVSICYSTTSVSARILPLKRVEKYYTNSNSGAVQASERASEWTYEQNEMALVFLIEICELTCVKRTTMTRAIHNNMWVFFECYCPVNNSLPKFAWKRGAEKRQRDGDRM